MDKTILADGEQIYGFVITHHTVSGEILLGTILQTAGWRDGDTSPVVDEGCFRIALHNKKKRK